MKSIIVIPGNDDAIRSVKLMASQMAEAINEGRGMAQSAIEQRAEAAMHGAAAGAVHIGEGGRIEYAGAPSVEMPPVDTGEGDSTADLRCHCRHDDAKAAKIMCPVGRAAKSCRKPARKATTPKANVPKPLSHQRMEH